MLRAVIVLLGLLALVACAARLATPGDAPAPLATRLPALVAAPTDVPSPTATGVPPTSTPPPTAPPPPPTAVMASPTAAPSTPTATPTPVPTPHRFPAGPVVAGAAERLR